MSTNFRYPSNPADLISASDYLSAGAATDGEHRYSRYTAPSTSRLEATLSAVLGGKTLVYSSGLAAFHALLVTINPKRLLIAGGYHGCHDTAAIFSRLTGMQVLTLDTEPRVGDLVHIESPINPTGLAIDIRRYAAAAHKAGAVVSVDATFAPPPLQDPFALGAHYVMHSGSKYLGGHSDMLAGTLSVRDPAKADMLHMERTYLGTIMGNMEAWLGMRSIKTLEMRVVRQSATATLLARWLGEQLAVEGSAVQKTVAQVTHASLQYDGGGAEWVKEQMPGGFGAVISLLVKTEAMAKTLPGKLVLWGHATSLGAVESLIEWRAMSDEGCDRRLLRLSVGVEAEGDLRADLERGFGGIVGL